LSYIGSYVDISVPGEPRKVKLKVLNSTAVKVTWRPPHAEEQNGIIRGYLIHYVAMNENDEPTSNPNIFNVVGGDKSEMTISTLEPDTWYQFQVNGYTRKGDGQRSRGRKVKTKGAGGSYSNIGTHSCVNLSCWKG
jgi:netrin-G3 ligand